MQTTFLNRIFIEPLRRSKLHWATGGLVACAIVFGMSELALAQVEAVQQLRDRRFMFVGNAGRPVAFEDDEPSEIEGGGGVKTDPDLESIMKKAERYRKDGNYRVATQLWQAVLERSGDSLFSSDGQTYYSMVRQVEGVLSKLPPEGLAAYRVNADAKAKEILAKGKGPNDRSTLSRIVRKYFVSSQGDEAAFRLGNLYLDEYDFIGARRLYEKIVEQYPDPSVSIADVHAKIAVCETFLGNLESARLALQRGVEIDAENRPAKRVAKVLDSLGNGQTLSEATQGLSRNWLMPLSDARRSGLARSLPADALDQDLVAVWQYAFEPKDRLVKKVDTVGRVATGKFAHDEESIRSKMVTKEESLLKKWQDNGWRPVGHLLFHGDLVSFKSGGDLTAWNRQKILAAAEQDNASAEVKDSIAWRSVRRNVFEVDSATRTGQAISSSYGSGINRRNANPDVPYPYSAAEVQLFGDLVQSQFSICGDLLCSLEGPAYDEKYNKIPSRVTPNWNQPYRRSRKNRLAAYDAESGIIQWTLPREAKPKKGGAVQGEESEPDFIEDGGFMAAPVPFGNLLIVPVNKGGTIWIYGLDSSNQGKTVWRSFLCDEPDSGAVAWSPIDVSIDGSDLFVTCGLGVSFVLDPATGTIRIAKRYARVGKIDPFYRNNHWSVKRAKFSGWSNDIVIPYGRQMICFSSDNQTIEALDRDTGDLVWRSEMNPIGYRVDYVLGVVDNMLYAAGKETIIAYDLKGEGRMIWGADQLFEGKRSLGRGMLTREGIYIPVNDKIFKFDLAGDAGKAKLVKKAHVDLGGSPVGNLYSDGERFWVHGGNRLYVLGAKTE